MADVRDARQCPKCNGTMQKGTLQQKGNFGNSPFVFSLDGAPAFPVKGQPSGRFEVVGYRCGNCGYLEWYAPGA